MISLLKTLKGSRLTKNLRTIGITSGTKMCHGWRNDGYCNGGNLLGAYIIENSLHYQDYEWYEALEDEELKEEALINKAIMEGIIDDDNEFEMIKYSFRDDEEYVAVKEDKYDDLTSTSKDAC
ncbi:hypothetical protein Tco_0773690 [Tanacetum coccineum]|uniref:Uncharacterized protein n=1 Tax=Tanacetum coccineum TaxID=301880 RepID=A0ABQ4ZLE3_9ASTR